MQKTPTIICIITNMFIGPYQHCWIFYSNMYEKVLRNVFVSVCLFLLLLVCVCVCVCVCACVCVCVVFTPLLTYAVLYFRPKNGTWCFRSISLSFSKFSTTLSA